MITKPYNVPAVSVGGVGKVAVRKPPEPLEVPGIETVARRPGAVIKILPLLVDLTSTMMLGFAPEHPEQKISMSSFCSLPVTGGVNVLPAKEVLLKPKPFVVKFVVCWSTTTGAARMTLFALVVRSVLVGTPVWKSACVVSVTHPPVEAAVSAKFFVVVPPSVTTIVVVVLEL